MISCKNCCIFIVSFLSQCSGDTLPTLSLYHVDSSYYSYSSSEASYSTSSSSSSSSYSSPPDSYSSSYSSSSYSSPPISYSSSYSSSSSYSYPPDSSSSYSNPTPNLRFLPPSKQSSSSSSPSHKYSLPSLSSSKQLSVRIKPKKHRQRQQQQLKQQQEQQEKELKKQPPGHRQGPKHPERQKGSPNSDLYEYDDDNYDSTDEDDYVDYYYDYSDNDTLASTKSRGPYFASENSTAEVFLGSDATLECTVLDLRNESVSWLRLVDDMLELLTFGSQTYSTDERYSLVQETGEKWQRWHLVIKGARTDDQGEYRCQVSTQPPMIKFVGLRILEPIARIVDERGTDVSDKHYKSGSMIELKCIIERVPFPHGPVTWKHGTVPLSFNTSRGGISVKGSKRSGYIRSRLYVADASPSDSGVYSCWYSNYTSDNVSVHVIAGEHSQAMQHDSLPEATTASGCSAEHFPSWSSIGLLLFCCFASANFSPSAGINNFFSTATNTLIYCKIYWKISDNLCSLVGLLSLILQSSSNWIFREAIGSGIFDSNVVVTSPSFDFSSMR